MAIALRSWTAEPFADAVTPVIAKPAGTAVDDVLILIGYGVAGLEIPTPALFTAGTPMVSGIVVGSFGTQFVASLRIFFRIVTGAEGSSFVVLSGTSYILLAYSGASVLAPINTDSTVASANGAVSTKLVIPPLAPTIADGRLVLAAGIARNGTQNYVITLPPLTTLREDVNFQGGQYERQLYVADRALTGQQAVPAQEFGINTPVVGLGIGIVLATANRAPLQPTGITVGGATNGGTADLSGSVTVTAAFNDPDAGDTPSGMRIRRKTGLDYEYWDGTVWNGLSANTVATTVPRHTFSPGEWSNGLTYNVGVLYLDDSGATGPWSDDIVIDASSPPSVTIETPVGVLTSGVPPISGTYSDVEGDPMVALEAAVFDADDVNETTDFATANALWRSGRFLTDMPLVTIGESLTNGNFVVALRVFQEGDLPSVWESADFTVNVESPPEPIPTVSFDDAITSVRLRVLAGANQLGADQSDLRNGIDGWVKDPDYPDTGLPVARTDVGMEITSLGLGPAVLKTSAPLAVAPNTPYSFAFDEALPEGDAVGQAWGTVTFFDDEGQEISTATTLVKTELEALTSGDPDPDPEPGVPDYEIMFSPQAVVSGSFANNQPLESATLSQPQYVNLDWPRGGDDDIEPDFVRWYWREGTAAEGNAWTTLRDEALVNDTSPPFEPDATPPFNPADYGISGVKQLRAVAVLPTNPTPPVASVEVIATFRTQLAAESPVAGDSLETFTDPRVLWASTGQLLLNNSLPRTITDQSQGGDTNARLLTVTKSWQFEVWTHNPGQVKAGYERRIYMGDLSEGAAVVPGDLTEAYLRFRLNRPIGETVRGDQKLPDLSGCDVTGGGGIDTAFGGFSQSGFGLYDGFTFGLMTSKWDADPTKYDLTVYISAFEVGGVTRRYPAAHLATSASTTPTGTTRLLLSKGVDYEIVHGGRLNTVGQPNGIYELYVTPVGAASRVLRYRRTDFEFRTRNATRINMFKHRNFWGGPIPTEAPAAETTSNTAPHMAQYVITRAVAALPLLAVS